MSSALEAAAARQAQLVPDMDAIYRELTDDYRRSLRVADLVYAAADRFPHLLPSRAAIAAERQLCQKDKAGLEIDQGFFVAHVLAHPTAGLHLMHSMSQPRSEALRLLDDFRQHGRLDLGPVCLERRGNTGNVVIQNHEYLNSEDDESTAALETAVDLILLDDGIEVGVLRGGAATHPKYAGRRIFGSGINLTHLYHGRISLIEFMLERELGLVSKMYRGHGLGDFRQTDLEDRREKPWIAAVESFAIGGACQWLLVMDRVIAADDAYFNLPAHQDGIIPGCANLRLPRFMGERLARQAIFFDRTFAANSAEGRLLADDVVSSGDIEAAVARASAELTGSGLVSVLANRKQMRTGAEPLDVFRRYMSNYARGQTCCLYSPALSQNLERTWIAKARSGA
jgi:thioesterase DpgC